MEELIPHSWFFGLHEEDVGVGRPGKVLHEWRAVLIAVHLGHHQVFHLHDQAELRVNMREHRLPNFNVCGNWDSFLLLNYFLGASICSPPLDYLRDGNCLVGR